MSVNPAAVNVAAAVAGNADAAVQQIIAAELEALAADAQLLQSQVTVGQVVTAQVLPSNGLSDLIQILGNRVAAALPPSLSPGDTFTAQVTGFDGPQILLQVLSTGEPGQPATPQSGTATLETPAGEAPQGALQLAATRPVVPEGVTPSIAPPPAVFVAASVRIAPEAIPGEPVTLPPPAQLPPQGPVVLADIEARLAAARAGSIGVNVPQAAPPPAAAAGSAPAPPPPAAGSGAANPPAASASPGQGSSPPGATASTNAPPQPPPQLTPGRFVMPPPITPSARFSEPVAESTTPAPATSTPSAPAPPASSAPPSAGTANANAAQQAPPPLVPGRIVLPPPITQSARFADASTPGGSPAANTSAPPAPTGLAAYRDPVALLRALNLPVTPTNVAAAQLATTTPQRLPVALATLESALPNGSDDPRVATLRTLTAFIGRIEPGSPQLAAQISAYVDNVVTGNEPKLAQLLTAQQAADQAAASPAGEEPAAAGSPLPPVVSAPPLPVVLLAQIAERGAALAADLKTQLLSLIGAPPAGSENADLLPAAASALTAMTSVQMNAAQGQLATPQTMNFTLPMWLGSGYAQAHIAVDRDAPEPSTRNLDGDNFHIAFILDTKHLGTVSIDLQTVGRAFSLAVKTENEGTAKRFADSLDRLTGRLESLRYRVNSAEATVAARGTPAPAATAVAEPEVDDGSGSEVNVRA